MGVNEMLTEGDGLLANGCPHGSHAFLVLDYPLGGNKAQVTWIMLKRTHKEENMRNTGDLYRPGDKQQEAGC